MSHSVMMLIGAICMKAFEPLRMISSVMLDLIAYQKRLGWCIVGSIIKTVGKKFIGFNRVVVNDAFDDVRCR